jgi:hypothetical protein|tara:strand:+ start:160 stop:345 length:186 start_codon:yes stop_codon:yes gene_type:complete
MVIFNGHGISLHWLVERIICAPKLDSTLQKSFESNNNCYSQHVVWLDWHWLDFSFALGGNK